MAVVFEKKNTILTKTLNNIIYQLMVKTTSEMVYTDDTTTLTETLSQIAGILTNHSNSLTDILNQIDHMGGDTAELKENIQEIWEYININGDPKSELIQLIDSKVSAEEGKGLSTNDFTDEQQEKLNALYTKAQLDELFIAVNETLSSLDERLRALEEGAGARDLVVAQDSSDPELARLRNGAVWFDVE